MQFAASIKKKHINLKITQNAYMFYSILYTLLPLWYKGYQYMRYTLIQMLWRKSWDIKIITSIYPTLTCIMPATAITWNHIYLQCRIRSIKPAPRSKTKNARNKLLCNNYQFEEIMLKYLLNLSYNLTYTLWNEIYLHSIQFHFNRRYVFCILRCRLRFWRTVSVIRTAWFNIETLI